MTARRLFAVGVALATLAAASAPRLAEAQSTTRFNVNRFETSERGSEWFAYESMDFRGKLRPTFGAVSDYAHRPLVAYRADGSVDRAIVANQFFFHLGASLNVAERFRFGVNLPVAVQNEGQAAVLQGATYQAPASGQGVGDLRLTADVRLVGEHRDPFTVAVGARFWAPTGDQASYLGDGKPRLQPQIIASGDIGPFVYAARTGVHIRFRDEAYADKSIGTELLVGGAAGVRVLDAKLVVGPELTSAFTLTTSSGLGSGAVPDASKPNLEGLAGAHYSLGSWRFGAGVGPGMARSLGTPVVRVLANIEFVPEIKVRTDRDGDGIYDDEDMCPDVKGTWNPDPAKNGCPGENDIDHDGIPDSQDACMTVPGPRSEDPRMNGCPPDRDRDGIFDFEDACPDTPGVRSPDRTKNGCPADSDGDGILDAEDACPGEPGPRTEDPKTNGCPDGDRDKDGIPNVQDACPDVRGLPDPDPQKNGCPPAFVKDGKIEIGQVKFRTASSEIDPGPESREILEALLKILVDHPELKKISVEGHTDSEGTPDRNKTLSANRAASVVNWLTLHKIDKDRLTSAGFGQERPIDTNETPEGRRKNRRVEFRILEGL